MTKEEEEDSGNDEHIKEMESLVTPNEEMLTPALYEGALPSSVDQTPPALPVTVPVVQTDTTTNEAAIQVNLLAEIEETNVDTIINNSWQSVLILKCQRRLAEQEALYRRLLREKDDQLSKITSNLCLLESKLRREQEAIERILDEKDKKITELDQHLQQLLRLNRRLAAGHRYSPSTNTVNHSHSIIKRNNVNKQRQRRRITWHNEVHIIHEYEPKLDPEEETKESIDTDQTLNEISELYENETESEPDVDCLELSDAINEACQAVDEALQEAETDEDDDDDDDTNINNNNVDNSNSSWTDLVVSNRSNNSASLPLALSTGDDVDALGATVVYNRIMNNHRTVTKPKDVKYKKISRVKSRSLEELRGKLKKPPTNALYLANSLTHRSRMVEQEEIL
ncbi:hypothetical protein CHUAL_008208 [Chamberlinius hualienensis]